MPKKRERLSRDKAIQLYSMSSALVYCRQFLKGWYQAQLTKALAQKTSRDDPMVSADDSTVSAWESFEHLPNPSALAAIKAKLPEFDIHFGRFHAHALAVSQYRHDLSGAQLLDYLRFGDKNAKVSALMTDSYPPDAPLRPAIGQPHAWIPVDHSKPDVALVDVQGATSEWLKRVVLQYYDHLVPNPTHVQGLGHAGHAYLVADADERVRPLFIKIARSIPDATRQRALEQLQERMFQQNIFDEYSGYALPRKAKAGAYSIIDAERSKSVSAFFFVNEVRTGGARHFEGTSCDEIEDVAEKYGRVNRVLVGSKLDAGATRSTPFDPNLWARIIQALSSRHELSAALEIARSHLDYLESTLAQLTAHVSSSRRKKAGAPTTLSDLHPHNVFTMNQRCLLIMDLGEARSDWPEIANVTFAAHRLCREYIRRRIALGEVVGNSPLPDAVHRSANAFLRGYRRGRSTAGVPRAIARTGTLWVKAVNFAKLSSSLAYKLGIFVDPRQRPTERFDAEIIKFLSYLWELDELQKVGWLSDGR